MKQLLPNWLLRYQRADLTKDLVASIIMTVLLVPQNLAYAMLAGLPPQVGLYAAMLPLLAYAWWGTSATLAIGPVAVASLMTAASLSGLAAPGSSQYLVLAAGLALLSGAFLLIAGRLRMGFLAHFLSHSVLSGFASGAAVLIGVSQLKHLLGIDIPSGQGLETLYHVVAASGGVNPFTLGISVVSILLLLLGKSHLAIVLTRAGITPSKADLLARLTPVAVVLVATVCAALGQWNLHYGVAIVGTVPAGMPGWTSPVAALAHWRELALGAFLIALVGFIQSVSVAQAMALRRNQKIDPDRELTGLGAANVASALTGGYPVFGGLARTAVSFAAGATTQLAGVLSVVIMLLIVTTLTPAFYYMPVAVLSTIIVVAISSLFDWDTFAKAWRYDRADALALAITFWGVLILGVEQGIVLGVGLSLGVLVWRSSRPHMAVVGRVPGTEHFRNVDRHQVETLPGLLALRVDESLFFANISALEDRLVRALAQPAPPKVILLICSAVNRIDSTALDVLTNLQSQLAHHQVALWLSEVKGPVTDRLGPTPLGQRLQGCIFLSTHDAFLAYQHKYQPQPV